MPLTIENFMGSGADANETLLEFAQQWQDEMDVQPVKNNNNFTTTAAFDPTGDHGKA
jgi:hypothetical protein